MKAKKKPKKKVSGPKVIVRRREPPAKFVLRLPRPDHKKLKDRAKRTGISMNELLILILRDYEGRDIVLKP